MEAQRQKVLEERERLRRAFEAAPFQYKVYPSDANFLLVEVGRANEIYAALVEKGVIVRNRNSVSLCRGCLRITVGTVDENTLLLQALEEVGVGKSGHSSLTGTGRSSSSRRLITSWTVSRNWSSLRR